MLMYSLEVVMQKYIKEIYMKLWETEKFVLDLRTGELVRAKDNMYIQGENFEHAYKRLQESNFSWLRLTGNWFKDEKPAESLVNNTPRVVEDKPKKEPKEFIGYDMGDWEAFLAAKVEFLENLDLDQLLDWLSTLNKEQVDVVWKECVEYGLLERVKVVEGYLKYRYGK